jgi:SAM-dependent methyltransferase
MLSVHAPTATIYDGIASAWQASRGEARDDLGRRFREQVGKGLVVDLGCGPGRYLVQLGNPVLAVDVSRSMLSLVARYGHPRAQADLESLPFAEGAFAGAFAKHSYLHVPKARIAHAFAELRRVLAPGGLALLSFIDGDYEGEALPEDDFPGRYFAFWRQSDLSAALLAAGFADIKVERAPRPKHEADIVAIARR